MLSLKKAGAPEAVSVSGAFYAIHTDFRYWLIFADMLKETHTASDFDFLYKDPPPPNRELGFLALFDFYVDKRELPRMKRHAESDARRAVDYDLDAPLIYAAFMEVYGIDLTEACLHWHKFRALFEGLHGTRLNDVIGYRVYDENDKSDYKKMMIELREAWELPEELTDAEKTAIADFDRKLAAGG